MSNQHQQLDPEQPNQISTNSALPLLTPSSLSSQLSVSRAPSPSASSQGGRNRQDSSASSRSTHSSINSTDYSSDFSLNKPLTMSTNEAATPISIGSSIIPTQSQASRLSTTPLFPSPLAHSSGPADEPDIHTASEPELEQESEVGGSPTWARHSPRGSLKGSPLARDQMVLFGEG